MAGPSAFHKTDFEVVELSKTVAVRQLMGKDGEEVLVQIAIASITCSRCQPPVVFEYMGKINEALVFRKSPQFVPLSQRLKATFVEKRRLVAAENGGPAFLRDGRRDGVFAVDVEERRRIDADNGGPAFKQDARRDNAGPLADDVEHRRRKAADNGGPAFQQDGRREVNGRPQMTSSKLAGGRFVMRICLATGAKKVYKDSGNKNPWNITSIASDSNVHRGDLTRILSGKKKSRCSIYSNKLKNFRFELRIDDGTTFGKADGNPWSGSLEFQVEPLAGEVASAPAAARGKRSSTATPSAEPDATDFLDVSAIEDDPSAGSGTRSVQASASATAPPPRKLPSVIDLTETDDGGDGKAVPSLLPSASVLLTSTTVPVGALASAAVNLGFSIAAVGLGMTKSVLGLGRPLSPGKADVSPRKFSRFDQAGSGGLGLDADDQW